MLLPSIVARNNQFHFLLPQGSTYIQIYSLVINYTYINNFILKIHLLYRMADKYVMLDLSSWLSWMLELCSKNGFILSIALSFLKTKLQIINSLKYQRFTKKKHWKSFSRPNFLKLHLATYVWRQMSIDLERTIWLGACPGMRSRYFTSLFPGVALKGQVRNKLLVCS